MKSVGLSRSDLAMEVSPVACQAPDASAIGEVHDSRPKVADKRIAELDGIRAIAIWMVLLSHIGYGFNDPAASLSLVPGSIRTIVSHGWLGVDLFFLLSGFLITGILIDTRDRPRYFRNFYTRRFLRIMPLYFLMIIVWSSLYSHSASYFLLSSVFGANLSALLHIHEPHGPGVLWSLAVEEHFYLLWPVVVLVSSRRTLVALSTCIFVVTPVLRGVFAARGMDANLIYMLSWFRFDGLAAGALLAVWARSRFVRAELARTISVALLLCCALLTVIGARYGFLGTHTPVAVALRYTQAYLGFGALFVLAYALRGSVWTSPLRWPLLQLSGALSYCLYLVHLSVGDGYEWMVRRIGIAPGASLGPGGALVLRGIVIILVSFAIALLTRRYVEEPCLALKDRVAGRTRSAEEPLPRLEPVQA